MVATATASSPISKTNYSSHRKTGNLECFTGSKGWCCNEDRDSRLQRLRQVTHDAWVIDGNYSKLFFQRRMEEADTIILLLFNRFSCLLRAFRRYLTYKNATRPDMAEGCNEKFDWEFMKWILYLGRTKQTRDRFKQVIADYPDKTIVIKNQRQLDQYLNKQNSRD